MREEKQEKLEALRKVANNPKLEYDLEADFDPDEHNRIMQVRCCTLSYYNEIVTHQESVGGLLSVFAGTKGRLSNVCHHVLPFAVDTF